MSKVIRHSFFNHCFVCGTLVDESWHEATVRDGYHICGGECLDEYLDMSAYDFEKCKKEYLDYENSSK